MQLYYKSILFVFFLLTGTIGGRKTILPMLQAGTRYGFFTAQIGGSSLPAQPGTFSLVGLWFAGAGGESTG